jgi:integrase
VTTVNPVAPAGASQQAAVDAALLLLERMGLSPADLLAAARGRPDVPTFAEYVPVVAGAVSAGTRRAYGSYWNRVTGHWGQRRLDEVTLSEIRQLMAHVKTHVVARRNARGGRSAAEHLVAALRCLYRHAEDDGLITEAGNPARKVAKPRRLPSTRRAVPDTRLAQINEVAAATGNDPELDTLLLRLHTETACRRGGALALRPQDLDADQCLILLREKGETVRWQPVSPTLMARLVQHGQQRHAPAGHHATVDVAAGRRRPGGRVCVEFRRSSLRRDACQAGDHGQAGEFRHPCQPCRGVAAGPHQLPAAHSSPGRNVRNFRDSHPCGAADG